MILVIIKIKRSEKNIFTFFNERIIFTSLWLLNKHAFQSWYQLKIYRSKIDKNHFASRYFVYINSLGLKKKTIIIEEMLKKCFLTVLLKFAVQSAMINTDHYATSSLTIDQNSNPSYALDSYS